MAHENHALGIRIDQLPLPLTRVGERRGQEIDLSRKPVEALQHQHLYAILFDQLRTALAASGIGVVKNPPVIRIRLFA